MEGPLKERLTGALIVVAVLVIVVPEMLSGPGRSLAPDTSADAGPPVRTYSLELGTTAAPLTQDQSALTPQSAEPPAPPVSAAPKPAPEPAPDPEPAPAAPVAQPPTPQVADVKPAAAPVAPAPRAASKGQWWTQLGSFSSRDNAERLARDLRGKGHAIDVARIRVGGKDLYRVRAGPVASREAAVALQSRLSAAGHKSSLVAP
ncbi:MAG: SPOR domain-containing protein [Proteobacteria bacterium]|nr:SPOR domain-containing protein [Pseudomonadota bacterium]